MTDLYVRKYEISFIYDKNAKEIAQAFPSKYMVNFNGDLIGYNAGFFVIEPGSVIDSYGNVIASNTEEFRTKYASLETPEAGS
ncbi:hypothetical protein RN333_15885 [Enterobacter kobei]|uniref:hypothetical protein n=1 Tax=Enterobacter kobei TaxID=208224 RepID=UPI0028D8BD2A|nr:hypothetical protein [Enterobacter kobei]WNP33561.1 hypothetical protein RN333_15885 [Enterobacter kobei]